MGGFSMGTRKESILNITEIFTGIQGEGLHQGVPSHFIRLFGCNLRCDFCDSQYSWKEKIPIRKEDLGGIIDALFLRHEYVNNVVITGGEPLLQNLKYLQKLIAERGWSLEIETNGLGKFYKHINPEDVLFNVSPKIHTEQYRSKYTSKIINKYLHYNSIFKFVTADSEDFSSVLDFCQRFKIPNNSVWILPKGITAKGIVRSSRKVSDLCIKYGFNLSDRQHIIVWGNRRGV
jgi:organic radical activating enzyme